MFRIAQRLSTPAFASHANAVGSVVEDAANWLGCDDDVVLGCESANPSLQIERWRHEVQPFPLTPLPTN